jgi:malate synthase
MIVSSMGAWGFPSPRPPRPGAEAGVRNNINVGIHYLGSWLAGNGCVPIHNLMEDAATAEISRAQLWQWVRHGATLADGRKVTLELVRQVLAEELQGICAGLPEGDPLVQQHRRAAQLVDQLTSHETFESFLTLPAYQAID